MSLWGLLFASPVVSLPARLRRDSPTGEANFIQDAHPWFSFEGIKNKKDGNEEL